MSNLRTREHVFIDMVDFARPILRTFDNEPEKFNEEDSDLLQEIEGYYPEFTDVSTEQMEEWIELIQEIEQKFEEKDDK